ncbi:MAG: hypothetical protein WEA09_05405 [Gemmatimonadota bacterium]
MKATVELGRAGFAMPLAILVIVVLAISLTGAFSMSTSERMAVWNMEAQQEAFQIAQAGLEEFLQNREGLGLTDSPPGALEEVDIPIGRGTAQVVMELIRTDGSDRTYVIRSTGVLPAPRETDPPALRTVAQLAVFQPGTIDVKAGWTSLTGLHKNGAAGTIGGHDRCGVEPSVAGVAAPTPPGLTTSGPFSPTGTPAVANMGSVQNGIGEVGIDWDGISNMTAITPTVTLPGGSWPSFANPNYWPVIHASGDLSLPGSGRGILIVTGDLTVNGAMTWEGIVLVGGSITGNGNNAIYGATISGLNAILQNNPQGWVMANANPAVGNGTKRIEYDSCLVAQAMSAFGGLRPMENTWMDNWQTW